MTSVDVRSTASGSGAGSLAAAGICRGLGEALLRSAGTDGLAVKILVVGSSTGLPSSLEPAKEEMVEKLRGNEGSSRGDVGNGGVS